MDVLQELVLALRLQVSLPIIQLCEAARVSLKFPHLINAMQKSAEPTYVKTPK